MQLFLLRKYYIRLSLLFFITKGCSWSWSGSKLVSAKLDSQEVPSPNVKHSMIQNTIWLLNRPMANGPFIVHKHDDLPIQNAVLPSSQTLQSPEEIIQILILHQHVPIFSPLFHGQIMVTFQFFLVVNPKSGEYWRIMFKISGSQLSHIFDHHFPICFLVFHG